MTINMFEYNQNLMYFYPLYAYLHSFLVIKVDFNISFVIKHK